MLQSGSNEEGSMNEEKGFHQKCSMCFGDRWDVTADDNGSTSGGCCSLWPP